MDVKNYLVTLGVRPAELSGLKELPGNTKSRLTPLLLLAPWLSTTPLSRSLDKFQEAYPTHPYFVDVDTYYQANHNLNEAKNQWQHLVEPPAKLDTWWQLLANYPNANPCLLTVSQPIERARDQIKWARENSRTFCLRMNLAEDNASDTPRWMPTLVEELATEGANDYIVVLEFGWVENPLSCAERAIDFIKKFFSEVSEKIPIVVSCTSFPKNFTLFEDIGERKFTNRDLVAKVQQQTNLRVIYGDWGSTKPRSYDHASQPKNRIDYPTDNSWIFARDRGQSVDFDKAARRITGSQHWSGNLGIWGEKLIRETAERPAFAIESMQKMYAARINIHLHRQAFYEQSPLPEALDEEWSDDL